MSQSFQYEPLPVSGLGVASLVTGILGLLLAIVGVLSSVFLVCCCLPLPTVVFGPAAALFGVAGGVLGYFSLQECREVRKTGINLAYAGLITNSIALGIGAIMTLVFVVVFGMSVSVQ
jgi:hypothetical protein